MRCEKCGRDFRAGLSRCPHCGAKNHYGGKTEIYETAIKSELSFQALFADTFKSHPQGAIEKLLATGTSSVALSPKQMLLEWDRPWLYMRVLGFGVIFVILSIITAIEGIRAGQTLLLTVPVFIMPLTVLVFFWEINIPRDISIYKVGLIFTIGGLLAIMMLPFLGHSQIHGFHPFAAFTEEPAKLLTTAIFIYLINPRYIFGGLLIGSAVGAGFGAFESFDYVMHDGNPVAQMIYRSVGILGAHLMWAAIEGGALVMVKGNERVQFKHFVDLRFLPYLAATIALHFFGNTNLTLMRVPFILDVKYILTSGVALCIVVGLINKGIVQILKEADEEQFQCESNFPLAVPMLSAVSGPLAGYSFPLERRVAVGRDPSVCNVIFPPDTPGISRKHCEIERRADGIWIKDTSSTGVYLPSGERLPPGQWVRTDGNFCLGSSDVTFSVDA